MSKNISDLCWIPKCHSKLSFCLKLNFVLGFCGILKILEFHLDIRELLYDKHCRLESSILSDDRRNVLRTNREELCRLIQLKEISLLDRLIQEKVISVEDKEIIEVSFIIILNVMYNVIEGIPQDKSSTTDL